MKQILGFFTDSKDRASVEALMGLVFLVASLVHGFIHSDPIMFGAMSGVGVSLLVTYAIGNNNLDKGK
jgi:hypothetical protein